MNVFTFGEFPRADILGLGVSAFLVGLLLDLPSFFVSGDLGFGDLGFLLRSLAVLIESPLFLSGSSFHAFNELWPTKFSVI